MEKAFIKINVNMEGSLSSLLDLASLANKKKKKIKKSVNENLLIRFGKQKIAYLGSIIVAVSRMYKP